MALGLANSPFHDAYERFLELPIGVRLGPFALELSLEHWVNDALMGIFFFVVGMEIKRELVHGELSNRERAMLPVFGALGGMLAPALIYTALHPGGEASRGWGIPMATDIAFALAALSVFGARVPRGLRVFLLALAIADDLGAVAVIAVFYTEDLALGWLGWAGAGLAVSYAMNRAGVRAYLAYLVVGAAVWLCTFHSGVHATIAGALIGMLTPTRPEDPEHETPIEGARRALEGLRDLLAGGGDDHGGHVRHRALREMQRVRYAALSPLDRLVNLLEPWVAYGVMPLFAFCNAGVAFSPSTLEDVVVQRVGGAVALGLVLGKPIGITFFSWLAVRLRVAALPSGVGWTALAATGVLAGIGFTVALFITNLAFASHPGLTEGSKIGILAGSSLAAVLGMAVLARSLPPPPAASAQEPAPHARPQKLSQ